MGSKSASKNIMINAGVPCVPGYHGDDQSTERLISEANKIGMKKKKVWLCISFSSFFLFSFLDFLFFLVSFALLVFVSFLKGFFFLSFRVFFLFFCLLISFFFSFIKLAGRRRSLSPFHFSFLLLIFFF